MNESVPDVGVRHQSGFEDIGMTLPSLFQSPNVGRGGDGSGKHVLVWAWRSSSTSTSDHGREEGESFCGEAIVEVASHESAPRNDVSLRHSIEQAACRGKVAVFGMQVDESVGPDKVVGLCSSRSDTSRRRGRGLVGGSFEERGWCVPEEEIVAAANPIVILR